MQLRRREIIVALRLIRSFELYVAGVSVDGLGEVHFAFDALNREVFCFEEHAAVVRRDHDIERREAAGLVPISQADPTTDLLLERCFELDASVRNRNPECAVRVIARDELHRVAGRVVEQSRMKLEVL